MTSPRNDLPNMSETRRDLFWARVKRGAAEECWPWSLKKRDGAGYGLVKIGGSYWRSHRVAFAISKGPIPAGLLVCHSCDNRLCCNPAHLWSGSNDENMADMVRKGRAVRRPGEESHNAKLTAESAQAVRRMYAAGSLYRLIAGRFGISTPTVASVIARRSWAHLPRVHGELPPRSRQGDRRRVPA